MVLPLIFVVLLVSIFWATTFQPWFRFICRFKLSVPEIMNREFSLRAAHTGTLVDLYYAVSADRLRVFVKTENQPSTMRWKRWYGMAVVTLNDRGSVRHVRWYSMTQVWTLLLLLFAFVVPVESHERIPILVLYLLIIAGLVFYEFYSIPKQLAEGISEIMNRVGKEVNKPATSDEEV